MAKKRKKKFSKTKQRSKSKIRAAIDKIKAKLGQGTSLTQSMAQGHLNSFLDADNATNIAPGEAITSHPSLHGKVGAIFFSKSDAEGGAPKRVMHINFTQTTPTGESALNDALRAAIENDGNLPTEIAVSAKSGDAEDVLSQLEQMVADMNEEARSDNNKPQYKLELLTTTPVVNRSGLFAKQQANLQFRLAPIAADAPPVLNAVMESAELREGLGKDSKLTGSTQYKNMLAALDAYHAHLDTYKQSLDNYTDSPDQLTTADSLKRRLLAAVDAYLNKHSRNTGGKKNAAQRLKDQINATDQFLAAKQKAIKERRKILIGGKLIDVEESDQNRRLYKLIEGQFGKTVGDVWFNSADELNKWMKNKGKLEGIGIWNGRWMNLNGKGPVVFGEEHNDVREDFVKALNINHRLIEGAFERSLFGMADADIPQNSKDPNSHKKYSGDATGKALENFWVRSAQSMARFFIGLEKDLEKIDSQNPNIGQLERLDELEEIMRTIEGIKPNPTDKAGIEKEINDELTAAKAFLDSANRAGLQELLDSMKKDYRAYRSGLKDLLAKFNTKELLDNFSGFRKSIENIGYLNFKANATPEDMAADDLTKNSDEPFTVWGGRRELFMLKNLEDALKQTPPPMITTLGNAHATNQKGKLEEMLKKYGGTLLIVKKPAEGAVAKNILSELEDFGAALP